MYYLEKTVVAIASYYESAIGRSGVWNSSRKNVDQLTIKIKTMKSTLMMEAKPGKALKSFMLWNFHFLCFFLQVSLMHGGGEARD